MSLEIKPKTSKIQILEVQPDVYFIFSISVAKAD